MSASGLFWPFSGCREIPLSGLAQGILSSPASRSERGADGRRTAEPTDSEYPRRAFLYFSQHRPRAAPGRR